MALYAIGDLHLSLTADKPMEVFGPAWENYTERIGDALSRLTAGDVLVLAGDTSWGIDLNEAEADFRFLDQFPCKKYLVKGNHDYWWSSLTRVRALSFEERVREIARMVGGAQETAATLSHAREMLQMAAELRNHLT